MSDTDMEVIAPLMQRLQEIYGDAVAEGIVSSMRAPKRTGYIVNPLVIPEQPLATPGEPVAALPRCFSVDPGQRDALLASPEVASGALYPINPSSVQAAAYLEVAGASEVLDLAAAPGGKTLLLAAAMGNRGRIAAVEPVKARFHRMRANLSRLGVTNVQYYQADGRTIGRKVPERFDAVLLDAPCSSESRIRIDEPDTFAHWKLRKVKEAASKQKGLLRSAFAALKPGGRLLYSTCSFAPEENELVVSQLLGADVRADVEPLAAIAHRTVPGLKIWRKRTIDPRLQGALRILPDELWDGFFVCLLIKR